nr:unnamed protein product [Callosobruchus analis]
MTSLAKKPASLKPERRKSISLCMGEEAEEIILQLEKEPATFQEALTSLYKFFIPRRNIIYERYEFNLRLQKPGESVDAFITSLHSLVEHCNYGSLKEELIRDRIVVGMSDTRTSERLQLKETLTLQQLEILLTSAKKNDDSRILNSDNLAKTTWSIIHEISGNNNKNRRQYDLRGNIEVQANNFNKHFLEKAPNLLRSIPKVQFENSIPTKQKIIRTALDTTIITFRAID